MDYVRQTLAALASAALFTACGGGGDAATTFDATVASHTATPSAPPPDIQLEGCVQHDSGAAAAVPVHARGEDGRLLASTVADRDGVFTLRVPAQRSVALSTEAAGPAELVVLTGRGAFSIGGCLRPAA